ALGGGRDARSGGGAFLAISGGRGFPVVGRQAERRHEPAPPQNSRRLANVTMLDPYTLAEVACDLERTPLGGLPPALRTLEDARAKGFHLQQTHDTQLWLVARSGGKSV